jgi:phenylacetate-coenzyme A ligase PaaK-like adenylate-forming protein
VYAATETGGIAAECALHTGMHLFEDLVLAEVVDADGRPVPPGVTGDRLLVTVLFSRTLPLIRYELTDRVRLATKPCPCGRPFRLLAAVEGRTDDLLRLPGRDGTRRPVHPVVFHRALELVDAAGWQVRQDQDELTVLVASLAPPLMRHPYNRRWPLGSRMFRSRLRLSAWWWWMRSPPGLRANGR